MVVFGADLHSACYGRLADAAPEELLRGQETGLNSDIYISGLLKIETVFVVISSIIYICSECVLFSFGNAITILISTKFGLEQIHWLCVSPSIN